MTVSLFDQFLSPACFGVPLILIALLIPWFIFLMPRSRWLSNRWAAIQSWLIGRSTVELFSPMSNPGHKWALMFISTMLFLISLNILGLLPYTFTPTTQLSLTLGLAFPLWLATVIIGFRNDPTASLAHLLPEGTPKPLIPVLIIIETISLLIRPLALGVRLMANLTAGHLLIQLIATATVALLSLAPAAAMMPMTLMVLLTLLEIAVAMIQAYVFVLLMTLYLQENV